MSKTSMDIKNAPKKRDCAGNYHHSIKANKESTKDMKISHSNIN